MAKSDSERSPNINNNTDINLKRLSLQCGYNLDMSDIEEQLDELTLQDLSRETIEPTTPDSERNHSSRTGSTLGEQRRYLPDACLFVASLVSSKTEDELQVSVTKHFRKWGELENVKVLKDNMNRPYSFVQFRDLQCAQRALREAPNTEIDGREIRVEQARVNRTLFITGLDKSHSKDFIESKLVYFGELEEFRLIKGNSKDPYNCSCFFKYKYREDAVKAFMSIKNEGKWIVEWASSKDKVERNYDFNSIFVGQINKNITKEEVETRFSQYGPIESLNFRIRQHSGYSIAFIKYFDKESCIKAIETEDGKEWENSTLKVKFKMINMEPRNRHYKYNYNQINYKDNVNVPPQFVNLPYILAPCDYSPTENNDSKFLVSPYQNQINFVQKVDPPAGINQPPRGVWVQCPVLPNNPGGNFRPPPQTIYLADPNRVPNPKPVYFAPPSTSLPNISPSPRPIHFSPSLGSNFPNASPKRDEK